MTQTPAQRSAAAKKAAQTRKLHAQEREAAQAQKAADRQVSHTQTPVQRSAAAKKAAQTRKLHGQEREAAQAQQAAARQVKQTRTVLSSTVDSAAESLETTQAAFADARTSISGASQHTSKQFKQARQQVGEVASAGQTYIQAETQSQLQQVHNRLERLAARSVGLGLALSNHISKTVTVWSEPTSWKQAAEQWEVTGRAKRHELREHAKEQVTHWPR